MPTFASHSGTKNGTRGVAQLASASGLGPEGPPFESEYPDKLQKELLEFQAVLFFMSFFH